MKPKFVYKTYHEINSPALYGEQMMLHTLLKDKVEFVMDGNIEGLEGAIINIRAYENEAFVDRFNEDISKLKWCLIIITQNEHGTDIQKKIKHPNCKIWIQSPKLSDEADYFLGFGWPSDDILRFEQKEVERIYDFSFSGQVNNFHRQQCVKNLERLPNTRVISSGGFNQGLSYPEYLELLSKTKFAACPSAVSTPDSFRIYEALEMGCVPVLDKNVADQFYKIWGNSPLMGVVDWDVLKFENMPAFEEQQKQVKEWWAEKKVELVNNLFFHIKQLS